MTKNCFPSISFSGCGLHVYYQVGVANELLKREIKSKTVCCTSAGMCSALYYLLDLRKELPISKLLSVLPVCSALPQVGNPSSVVFKGVFGKGYCPNVLAKSSSNMIRLVCKILKDRPHAYKEVSGHLFVTICQWPSLRTHIVSCWDSNNALIETLKKTTTIPYVTRPGPFCSSSKKCGTEKWVDGGFVNSHPIVNAQTVCVTNSQFSIFSPAAQCKGCRWGEISAPLCTDSAFLVRSTAYYHGLYRLGKKKAKEYLKCL
jgi:predicted acylesterase/phospholipase RssA